MRVVGKEEMKDTTLLIQGPLMEDTYKFYCGFYPEVPKIFSTWEGNEERNNWRSERFDNFHSELLERRELLRRENILLIKNKMPDRFYEKQNLDLQLTSVLSGLKFVETKHVIKLRGDEWYSNLNRVCAKLASEENKILFAPIYFRNWEYFPFHVSDHLLAGTRYNIKTMFSICAKSIFENRVFKYTKSIHGEVEYVAESMLGRSYLEAKTGVVDGDDEENKNRFKNNFGLIDIQELSFYKVSSNSANSTWYSNFKDEDSINSMEDL